MLMIGRLSVCLFGWLVGSLCRCVPGLTVPYLKELKPTSTDVNYNTYNYLGLAKADAVKAASIEAVNTYGASMSSSPIVGQPSVNVLLERELVEFLGVEAAVAFIGGWQANVTTIDVTVITVVTHALPHATVSTLPGSAPRHPFQGFFFLGGGGLCDTWFTSHAVRILLQGVVVVKAGVFVGLCCLFTSERLLAALLAGFLHLALPFVSSFCLFVCGHAHFIFGTCLEMD